jgi:hypothetical protein
MLPGSTHYCRWPSWVSIAWHLVVVLLVVFGIFLRWYGLERHSLWADELFAVINSHLPSYADLWAEMKNDSNPPGYLSFMYFILPWTGYTDAAIRSTSLVAGCLLLPLVYLWGARQFSAPVGLVALALAVPCLNAIYFSQEARCYSILAVTCAIYSYTFIEVFLRGKSNLALWLLLWLTATVALYLHYASLVFVGLTGLYFLFSCLQVSQRLLLLKGCALYALVLLAYVPWLGTALWQMQHMPFWAREPQWEQLYSTLMFFWGAHPFTWYLHLLGTFGAVALLLVDLARQRRLTLFARVMLFLLLTAFGPVLVFYVKSKFSQSVFVERYFMCSLPAALLLPAVFYGWLVGLLRHPGVQLVVIAPLLVAFVCGQTFVNVFGQGLYLRSSKMEIREAVLTVSLDRDFVQSGSAAIFTNGYYFDHYLDRFGVRDKLAIGNASTGSLEAISTYLRDHAVQQFYVIEAAGPPSTQLVEQLRKQYSVTCKTELHHVDVVKFAVAPGEDQKSDVPACSTIPEALDQRKLPL